MSSFESRPDAGVRLAIRFDQQGGASAAFDRADAVEVAITAGGETLFSGSLPRPSTGSDFEGRITLPLPGALRARIEVALTWQQAVLFTGAAEADLEPGRSTTVILPLTPRPDGLDLTPPPIFTRYGESADLEGAVVFATGDPVPDLPVVWTSSAPAVVRVEALSGGGYRAVSVTDGQAQLQATAGGISGSVAAVVEARITSIDVVPSSIELVPGQEVELVSVPREAGGAPVPGRIPAWSSSDEAVATVDAAGTVVAVAIGTALVEASADGASGTATVYVLAPGPSIETLAPTGVGGTTATARALVDPAGRDTDVVFRYGTDPSFASASVTAPLEVPATSGPVEVTAFLTGLLDGTTYHVRAEATNGAGSATGDPVSFTTRDLPNAPSGLSARFVGGVRLTWIDASDDETRFEIEREVVSTPPTFSPQGVEPPTRVFEPVGSVGTDVTRFDDSPPAGLLRYRVRACGEAGCSPWSPALDWYFGYPPAVTTLPPTDVGEETAILRAAVNPFNAPTVVFWEVDYSASFAEPAIFPSSPLPVGDGASEDLHALGVDGLQPGATFFVRAVAVNAWGAVIGQTLSFSTPYPEG